MTYPSDYQNVKAEGGERYAALLASRRESKRASRSRRGRQPYDKGGRTATIRGRQGRLVGNARRRARDKGLAHNVKWADIHWPTHCPVLGIELNYMGYWEKPAADRKPIAAPNAASLDRWDNSKGYVLGNVYVISLRANELKSNASVADMEAVLRYMRAYPAAGIEAVQW